MLAISRASERAGSRGRSPEYLGDRGQLERLLRRVQRRLFQRRSDSIGPDLARLLSVAERGPELPELAGSRLPRGYVAVRGTISGAHEQRRRSGSGMGWTGPFVRGIRELGRPGALKEDVR